MKIQIIAHNREINPQFAHMRWDRLPLLFEKSGHEVDHVLVKDWKRFYFRYLKFRPDVLISAGIIGSLPVFLKKIKLIRAPVVHDWTDDYTDVMGKTYGIDRIAFLEHFIIKNSDFITTPSRFLQKKCEIFGKRAVYIPHGVNPDFMGHKPYRLKGKIKVVYVGSQSVYKMTDKVIESARGLDCDLYLFGKTNEEFKKIAPGNVHFMGPVHHTEIPRCLMAADILILAADDDSTLKMFEYIKAGKCILGLKGRAEYFLTHGENAFLAHDLREGLKTLIENRELRNHIAAGAKKMRIHAWEEIAEMYLDFLYKIVNNQSE
jgi:glycosyltransferase involved in cell wall biosynthesis